MHCYYILLRVNGNPFCQQVSAKVGTAGRGTNYVGIRYQQWSPLTSRTKEFHEVLSASGKQCHKRQTTTPITLRVPKNLKDAAAEAVKLRDISFSAFIRSCIINELAGRSQPITFGREDKSRCQTRLS